MQTTCYGDVVKQVDCSRWLLKSNLSERLAEIPAVQLICYVFDFMQGAAEIVYAVEMAQLVIRLSWIRAALDDDKTVRLTCRIHVPTKGECSRRRRTTYLKRQKRPAWEGLDYTGIPNA